MSIIKGANAHGISVSDDHLKRPGLHNQRWLVEDVFPLRGVEVAWSDELREFNYELLDLGLQVAHPVDDCGPVRGLAIWEPNVERDGTRILAHLE
jgi:hypothetical protein